MPRHWFFDLDKTLTRSRSPMEEAHQAIFGALSDRADVIVVSGGELKQIEKQVPEKFKGRYVSLSQSGNHVVLKDGTILWSERFTDEQKRAVFSFILRLHDELKLPVRDEDDLVEDRGSQISYSLIGHHEDIEKKEAFDPDAKKRLDILKKHAADVEALKAGGADVRTGGTTTFDFTLLGKHKGYNIARFIEKMGWKKEDCLYIGDALFPGGNDETVIGVIPTHAVNDYDETFEYISDILKNHG